MESLDLSRQQHPGFNNYPHGDGSGEDEFEEARVCEGERTAAGDHGTYAGRESREFEYGAAEGAS